MRYILRAAKKINNGEKMKIITDTREQKPYWKDQVETLSVGDYTTTKLKGVFHVERKSLQDLYGTMVAGNQRFKAELFRAAWERISIAVYVEGSMEQFINKDFPYGKERKFSSHGLEQLIKTFTKKYHLAFYWHKNRESCKKAVKMRLLAEEKSQKKT